MIRCRPAALAALVLSACSDGSPDPCADIAGTCLALRIDSEQGGEIDELELDLLYGDLHATTSTQADGGGAVSLPVLTAVDLDLADLAEGASLAVGVVAAGKLDGSVLGAGAGSAVVRDGERADLDLELAPLEGCTDGEHYCGGNTLPGDPDTVYACNAGGVPLARGVCTAGCIVRPDGSDVCAADDAPCVDGGFYCGGDKLEGDPQTLYVCAAAGPEVREVCPDGCLVRPGVDDACR
ncbi:MAG TPA: hypothetical protein VNO33_13280 [Kofleriaceae bacterium]|nr:hypothetical protein [Kofleriaceae bacterium]